MIKSRNVERRHLRVTLRRSDDGRDKVKVKPVKSGGFQPSFLDSENTLSFLGIVEFFGYKLSTRR